MRRINQFWKYVRVGDPKECWEWLGRKNPRYGIVDVGGKTVMATHIALQYSGRKAALALIKSGLMALHKCGNPGCVNPNHLYAGTAKENTLDAVSVEFGRPRWKIGGDGS